MPGRKDQGKNINEERKVHQSTERTKELIQGSHSNSNKHSYCIRLPTVGGYCTKMEKELNNITGTKKEIYYY